MALTGDLENLHIVDVIQLLHATRKSGTFSVKGARGESRIILSNGYIVAASHLNNRIRIGTVLVKMNAINREDLKRGLEVQKSSGTNRKPLIATLVDMGILRQEEAYRCLKKLIEITIVELIGWTRGTFTFDTEAIAVSPECKYVPSDMDQTISLDAQMVLMDALRVYDERERDRSAGIEVKAYEDEFVEVLPEGAGERAGKGQALTAEMLGLADLDHLEKKVQKPFSVKELFDPLEIRREEMREILTGFSKKEQDTFISFLEKSTARQSSLQELIRHQDHTKALILFSADNLLKHAIMAIYKNEGIPVFATDREEEFDNFIAECLSRKIAPILVYDAPETSGGGFPENTIIRLRQQVREMYPQVSEIELASPLDHTFTAQSSKNGIKTVLPKPIKDAQRETFIEDSIQFLETFRSSIKNLLSDKTRIRKQ